MRFTITPNYAEQCFDIRIQRGINGKTETRQVVTKDLLAWLQREICEDTFGELVMDTQAVDTLEPRYLMVVA